MSPCPLTGISHCVVWVKDLDHAAEQYHRLGFNLTQKYVHPKSVGTANYNMMFENDYLELLVAIEDNPRNSARIARLEAEGDGLKDVALATKNADAAFEAITATGLTPLPVFDHHRPEGNETARFRLIYLPPDQLLPGLGFHVNQRVTPELMWRGKDISHPNGTRGIAGLIMCADDPQAIALPYARMFGVELTKNTDGFITVAMGRSTLSVGTPAQMATFFPGIAFTPKPPFVAGLELFVDDPAKTAAFLAKTDIPHRIAPDGAVEVPPEDASGVALRFVPSRLDQLT